MAGLFYTFKLKIGRRELRQARADFYFELGASLLEHVPLVTALRKYEMRARTRGSILAPVYLEMLRGLQSGSMTEALKQIASPLEQTLMDATQTAGDQAMAEGLKFMSETVEKIEKMRTTLFRAMAYPVVLLALFSGMLTSFSLVAVPVLVQLIPVEKWPPLGKVLFFVSELVAHQGLYVLMFILMAVSLFIISLSRWTGRVRRHLDEHFPYNIYRDHVGSMLLVSLAAMMRSGISLRSSLARAEQFSSPWLRWHIRKIMLNLSRPNTPYFGQAFRTGVLNQEMGDKVQDASERRDPVASFIRAGSNSIDRMMVLLERRSRTINIVMIVFCSVVLGLMFAGFLSTAMSVQSSIRDTPMG